MSADGQPVAVGAKVVLRRALFGYEQGTVGIVIRSGSEPVYVRFETTGHTLAVPRDALATPEEAAEHD